MFTYLALFLFFLSLGGASASTACTFLPDAPPYVKIAPNCDLFVRFGVFVTSNNGQVNPTFVKNVLSIIKSQVSRDFKPYYGLNIDITYFSPGSQPEDWGMYIPIVIADYLTPFGALYGLTVAWTTQDSSGLFGSNIYALIKGPLPTSLPQGAPWLAIIVGNSTTLYGLTAMLNTPSFWPLSLPTPITFQKGFLYLLDYAVLSVMGSPSNNKYQLFEHNGSYTQDFYAMEAVQPVAGEVYSNDGSNYVINFVLPSFWQQGSSSEPFDYLDTVPDPFTPWKGHVFFERFNATGQTNSRYYLISPQDNPSNPVLLFLGPALVGTPPADPSEVGYDLICAGKRMICMGNSEQFASYSSSSSSSGSV